MQKKIRFFTPFIILILACSLPAAEESGYLSVSADDSMQIYVDTVMVGEGQITYLPLPAGRYTVHAYNPYSLNWSDRGNSKKIEIFEAEHLRLDLRMQEEVKIISVPFSSKVFAGKDLLGQTPLIYKRNSIAEQTLRIENKGFKDKSFNLIDGQSVYRVSLDPLESDRKQSHVLKMKDSQNQIKWYREGLVVTSLLSSWASFYFKREADKSYAKYQRASDSREMIALYAETERFDRISEIAIGVSAITLGTYLYLLLLD
jgi:hypothetical protein